MSGGEAAPLFRRALNGRVFFLSVVLSRLLKVPFVALAPLAWVAEVAPTHWRRAPPALSNAAVPRGCSGGMPGSRASRAAAQSDAEKLCCFAGEVSVLHQRFDRPIPGLDPQRHRSKAEVVESWVHRVSILEVASPCSLGE